MKERLFVGGWVGAIGVCIALAFSREWGLPLAVVCLGYFLLYGRLQQQVCCDISRRRWVAMLFHLGVAMVCIGGGMTAFFAKEQVVEVGTPSVVAPHVQMGESWVALDALVHRPRRLPEDQELWIQGRWRTLRPALTEYLFPLNTQTFSVDGSEEVVTLERFAIETYPNGMPSQYRTHLKFAEGSYALSVNRPLRRKGYTYYQMSYAQSFVPAVDANGSPVFFRAVALDDQLQARFDASGRVCYDGDLGDYPLAYPVVLSQLLVRKDPGAPVTFVGYGILILAALAMALREEVQ